MNTYIIKAIVVDTVVAQHRRPGKDYGEKEIEVTVTSEVEISEKQAELVVEDLYPCYSASVVSCERK